ncbi:hypothetical protein G6553_16825 [Nocardioides sp. IC4_145]|uniref:hypothetical protein n=1 Tax=Nocardioides sp. IC4_145 TaxID=2714037 RepID=UPI00140A7CEE|nr:hypothetical protein [Nocardioides sp. IC4_145]NHC24832.1 hypothetical protein [Nocardioides sp. IC4_145]
MAAAPSARDVVLAVAPSALGLVDPTTLSPRARTAYRLGLTVTTSASALDGLRDPELHAPPAVQWLGAAAVAGLTWRTMPRWERADVSFHRWLADHGLRRSRLVVSVASAAALLAIAAAERRRAAGQGVAVEEGAEAGDEGGDEVPTGG